MGSHGIDDGRPESELSRPEPPTRLRTVWMALAIGILALILILIFILQNPQKVHLSFLGFHGQLPLGVAVLFAWILGAVIMAAFGSARMFQLRTRSRGARHQDGRPNDRQ